MPVTGTEPPRADSFDRMRLRRRRRIVPSMGKKKIPIFRRRAELVVRFACELLGVRNPPDGSVLKIRMKVEEFEALLKRRYGDAHPELVHRSDSAIERARLDRDVWPDIPKVVLQQGAPLGARRRLVQSAAPEARP